MTQMQTQTKENEIWPLTSFRFLAAVAVFLSHLGVFKNFTELKPIYERYFYEGYIGVTFFFVLSGFILTYNYHTKISSFNPAELRKFYVARVARIYPIHILTFVLSLPLVYQAFSVNFIGEMVRAVLNLPLLQGLVPIESYYFSFNMPAWSLSGEIFFYALLPLILALWVKSNATSPRRSLIVAMSLWSVAFLIVWLWQNIAIGHWLFYIAPYFRLFDFSLGIALCFIFLGIRYAIKNSRMLFTLCEVGSLAALATAFYFFPQVPQPFRYSVYYTPFISLVILVFAFQRGWLSALLSKRVLVLGGEISFSFYMFHQLVLRYMEVNGLFSDNPVPAALAAFGITVVLSYVCYRLYELPMREKIKQSVRWSPTPGPTVQANSGSTAVRVVRPTILPVISRRLVVISVLILAAVAGVTYFPSLRLGFLGETWNSLEWAAKLTASQNLTRAIDPRVQIVEYRPLLTLTFWGEYLVFQFDVFGYHIFKMIVHLANVLLLFALVGRIAGNWRLAFISAVLFAGFPVYIETLFHVIDFFAEITFLQLLSVWAWISFLRSKQIKYYVWAVGAFVLALLGKEQSITAIVTLFLVDRLLIHDGADWTKLFWRYFPFGVVLSVYLALEYVVQINGRGISALGWSVGPHAVLNLLNYLTQWIFPWTPESPLIYLWVPLACVIITYLGVRQRSSALAFLVLETLVLIGVVIWSPRVFFTTRYLYMPTMTSAILIAALFDWLWTRWGKPRNVRMILAGAVGVLVLANAISVADAAADWNETVRQRRVPFRDIAQSHPAFPDDTFIYLVGPQYFRDLSGPFLARYGDRVLVGSTVDDPYVDGALYPLFQRLGVPIPTTGIGLAEFADWRSHQNPLVYYFDATGKPIEVRVAQNAATDQTPASLVNFNAPIRFEGSEITNNVLQRGDTLVLLLYWRALGAVDKDYTIFLHLVNEKGDIVFGEDAQPRGGRARTSAWTPGKLVVDPHLIPIADEIPPGVYHLEVGLYYLPTMERLSIVDEQATPIADKIVIEPFQIQ